MILNCLKVVDSNDACKGYLCMHNEVNILSGVWHYHTKKELEELRGANPLEEVDYIHWSDTDSANYILRRSAIPFTQGTTSYTYLQADETQVNKLLQRSDIILLIPQAIWRDKHNYYYMVTALGKDLLDFETFVNTKYPTMKQCQYTESKSIFRFMCTESELFEGVLKHAPGVLQVSTTNLYDRGNMEYFKYLGKEFRLPEIRYYMEAMIKLDDFDEAHVMPDITKYLNIMKYQSMMELSSEAMAEEIKHLYKLYNVNSLVALDNVLASKV